MCGMLNSRKLLFNNNNVTCMKTIFNVLFQKPETIAKYNSAPFLKERITFLEQEKAKGKTINTIRRYAKLQLIIMDAIQLSPAKQVTHREILSAQAQYGDANRGKWAPITHKTNLSYFKYVAIEWLFQIGLYHLQPDWFFQQEYVYEYLTWLKGAKGLSPETIEGQFYVLRDMMRYFEKSEMRLNMLKSTDIDKYLEFKSSYCKRNSISSIVYQIKSFFQYSGDKAYCSAHLYKTIKAGRVYSYEGLPSYIPWKNVEHIVNSYPRKTPKNKRDFAMILLFSIYGMRCSEVTNLKLKDVDWRYEKIALMRAKNSRPQHMPLLPFVGDAILDYLKVRPNSFGIEEIFLSSRGEVKKLSPSAAYTVTKNAILKENVKSKHRGPHTLRHSFATHLVNSGHPMKEIADMLGHQYLDTTRIYAKVDFVNLRKVADMNWEGVL